MCIRDRSLANTLQAVVRCESLEFGAVDTESPLASMSDLDGVSVSITEPPPREKK